jgi:DNA-binding beta-propeller fold protein YncE
MQTSKRFYGMNGLFLLWVILCSVHPVYAQPSELPIIASRHLFDIKASFLHPSDVTVGSQGRIYVLDGVNNVVKIFNSSGKYLSSFGSRGKGGGKCDTPLGIDSARDGSIYLADSGNRLIQVFDASGSFRFQFPVQVKDSLRPPDPVDVVIDEEKDRCYVIDNDNHRVLVYTKDGSRLVEQWGTSGEKPGEFQFPFLAALDNQSTLYVVDVLNTRVQAINHEGRALAYIGKWGVDRGQFYRPKGVALDKKERIYVSDSYLGVVQVFKRYRKFLGVLGNGDGEVVRFKTPTGLYVDDTMRLYVVEMLLNRVSVYQILE